jgi:alpha-1,6-mannosyltransferase
VRVVHVANAYTPRSGGIRTTVLALGHGYQAAGHEFVPVVPGPRTSVEDLPWGRRITLAGPKVPGAGGYRVLADLRKLRTILYGLEPDRLEVSDRLTLRGLGRWAGSAGVPSTVIAHERVDGILRAFTPLGARGAQLAADRHNATTAEHFDRVALRVLHLAGCPARLVVAGSGPLSASLRRRARGLPVELVGHLATRSAVAGLLGAADVVLAPGPVETFGLAALEALACGTPVVAASTSAVAELVGGGAGRSARPEPAALAAAVSGLLAMPEGQRRRAARTRAESFPWSRTTDTMLALHGLQPAVRT